VVVSDNDIHSYADWGISAVARNDGLDTVHGSDIIIERNFITGGIENEQQVSINTIFVDNITVRNNITLMNEWQRYRGINISEETINAFVYNNSCYTNDDNSFLARCINVESSASSVFVSNNLIYAPNKIIGQSVISVTVAFIVSSNIVATDNPFISKVINQAEDFRIFSESIADNQGTNVPVLIDYSGIERVVIAQIDVGAFVAVVDIIFRNGFE
jgi:hypothetical protein